MNRTTGLGSLFATLATLATLAALVAVAGYACGGTGGGDATDSGTDSGDVASTGDAGGDAGSAADASSDAATDAGTDAATLPSGSLDPSYGDGGLVSASFGVTGDRANAMAIQTDGKILAAGHAINEGRSAAAVVRYGTGGSFDATFGSGGTLLVSSAAEITAIALQADGKIVMAVDGGRVVRLQSTGALDTTFGTAGIVTLASATTYAVAVQPDGKIVVGGQDANKHFYVARLGALGALDLGFGTSGSVSVSVPAAGATVSSVTGLALQTNGAATTAILATGPAADLTNGEATYYSVIRLSGSDGSLDTSFNGSGITRTTVSGRDQAAAVLLQPDGKVVVAGTSVGWFGTGSTFTLLRYTAAGALDATFNSGDGHDPPGVSRLLDSASSFSFTLYGVALEGGQIVVAGKYTGIESYFAVARASSDGTIDKTFSGSGEVSVRIPSSFQVVSDGAYAVAVQSDDKIVAVGSAFTVHGTPTALFNEDFAVVRFVGATGARDTTFGTTGVVTTNVAAGDDGIEGLAVQPDGKVIAAGYAFNGVDDDMLIARFDQAGVLDPTFGGSGFTTVPNTGVDVADAVAVQLDGRVFAAGHTSAGFATFATVRFDAAGVYDSTFGIDYPVGTPPGTAHGVAVQTDGKILVGGEVGSPAPGGFVVARLLASGAADNWGVDGGASGRITTGPAGGGAYALSLLSSGKIALAGNAWGVVQYTTNGALDPSFGGGTGKTQAPITGAARALAGQSSGQLVAAGFAQGVVNRAPALVRFDAAGALDQTFGTAGTVTMSLSGDAYATALLAEPDDKLVCAVTATASSSLVVAGFAASGAPDMAFGQSGIASIATGGTSASATAVARQPDGKIVAAGSASNGAQRHSVLARLRP